MPVNAFLEREVKKIPNEQIDISKGKYWVDLRDPTQEELELFGKKFDLHPLTLEDCKENTAIKLERFNKYVFLALYGVHTVNGKMTPVQLNFIIGKNFLITTHKGDIESFQKLKKKDAKLKKLFSQGIDFLFHELVDKEVDSILIALEKINNELEDLEDKIIRNPRQNIINEDVLELRKEITEIKKIALPQKNKIGTLFSKDNPYISSDAKPYFRDIYDHMVEVEEEISLCKDSVKSIFDLNSSMISNALNANIKFLTALAALLVPLSLIAGIYGMNVTGLPFADVELGGFWIIMGVMAALFASMLFFFKSKKWI